MRHYYVVHVPANQDNNNLLNEHPTWINAGMISEPDITINVDIKIDIPMELNPERIQNVKYHVKQLLNEMTTADSRAYHNISRCTTHIKGITTKKYT